MNENPAMRYRTNPKNGDRISQVGFGFMRMGRDPQEAARIVRAAVERGINYFDTAYVYPGNEAQLGSILAEAGLRDSVYIATKLPPYLVRKAGDLDRILESQLSRLRTGHIDYYLMHMLPDAGEWARLKGLGILEWLERKVSEGTLRNIGFSYHGGVEAFEGLIDAHAWDFCMLQYNYYDVNNQAGRRGLLYAAERGVPVLAMEPLRGGKLASGLPKDALSALSRVHPDRTPAEWGLRWVLDHPEILCCLSGMSAMAMLEENARIGEAAEIGAMTAEEHAAIDEARRALRAQAFVPCTGCGYCMPCPQGVDIPLCFSSHNDLALTRRMQARLYYILRTDGHNASRCTACGKCVRHCPQAIDIPAALSKVTATMERFPYRPARAVARRVMRMRRG